MRRFLLPKISFATVLSLAVIYAASAAGLPQKKADSVHTALTMKSNCPRLDMSCSVPLGLSDSEKWVFLGEKKTPGEMLKWTWAKPSQSDPTQWTELFEYENVPRGKWTAKKYLAMFNTELANRCASAKLIVVRQSDTELLFEINSVGCPSHSDDEIDLFLFGKSDLFQVVYTVKGREMSEEQRKVGLAALSNWGLNPQKE
jgi:hypothetical protein